MPTIQDVLRALESVAPARFAFEFDHIGLQVGSSDAPVTKAVVSLDRSLAAAEFTIAQEANLLLSHHPLIWDPLKSILEHRHAEKTAMKLIRANVNFIAAHTNWDCAQGGINDVLAKLIGLANVKAFGFANGVEQIKIVVFVPPSHADAVIDSASETGAGVIGNYTRCAFTSTGTGTFIGDANSNPTIGQPGVREFVDEQRIEMLCRADLASKVVRAIRSVHPYEEPAIDAYKLESNAEQAAGRIGQLEQPKTLAEFAQHVDKNLETKSLAWGDPAKKVRTVAVVGGAADAEWLSARNAGADVFVTGEVKQNIAVEASESGMPIIAAGHYAMEHPGCVELRNRMAEVMPDVEWLVFEPKPGLGGRPL